MDRDAFRKNCGVISMNCGAFPIISVALPHIYFNHALMNLHANIYPLRAAAKGLLLFLLLALGALLSGCFREDDAEIVQAGDRVPAFSVTLSDGTIYDSTQRDGRGAIIVFFATWCGDCQRELPVLDSLYRAGRFDSQHVVCIGREEPAETVAAFWESHSLALPYSPQADRRIFNLFANSGVPRIYNVAPDGTVRAVTYSVPK